MHGGFCTDFLVKLTFLFLTLTSSLGSAQDEISLPEWSSEAEYVTQCMRGQPGPLCDMTVVQQAKVTNLNIGPLKMEGQACLEFWHLSPVLPNIFRLTAYLKTRGGLKPIWSQTAQPSSEIRTWTQVFVPLNIDKPGTKVVFRAIHPIPGGEQVIVNRIGIRRGSCGPQCEANTQFWPDESTRCLCSEGQLSCFHAPSSGMCTIHSHTDCSTFDGTLFRFMESCSYTLAKTCSVTENLPQFNVEVVSGQNNNNSSLPSVEQINVNINNFRMSLLKRQTGRVVVNGVWRTLPLTLSSGTVTVTGNPAAVVLKSSFGLLVSFDYTGALHVTLPSTYSDKVCGLCGNFNHIKGDDLQKPGGTYALTATELVESWRAGENTSDCEAILVPHYCDPLEETEYASEAYCGALVSNTGPFAACQEVLGAESYFRGCVNGMCASHGDTTVLCNTLQVYAETCQKAGITVPMWRNSSFCSLQCGENSHYNSCAEGCPEVCSTLDQVMSCGSCEERCECDPGFKLSGGRCVQAEECGCWFKGQHYEKGSTFMEGECIQQCTCIGNNNIQCTSTHCSASEVCGVQDGVKGCFPFRPATCSVYGDPHYITFDGFAYDFHGGCSYILTKTCGGQSSVQFTVTGHNMYPPHNNFTRSKLEAVTLEVGDLQLTLNQSGHIYEHNSHVLLPYSNSGTYGQVRAYVDTGYTVVDTTFGLRMMIDGHNRLFLQVNEHYKYELCGLCGTYSNRQDDDLVMPGGQNATSSFQFGDSWRVQDSSQCVSHPNNPRQCNSDELSQAYNECYALLDEAFRLCHEAIHPEVYITSCVQDYCATNGDRTTLCESLRSYAAACDVAGVELGQWESSTVCAVPTTTATPATTTTASPTPDQTLCPLNCDFENSLCGWEQLVQDSFDWTRYSGATPSSETGPSHDHTSGAGFYMYIEGDSVTHGDSARMLSSLCQYSGPMCLHFWYHMYGSATAMALNMYMLQGNRVTKIWSKRDSQGPVWQPGQVEITASGPFQVILEGIRGSTTQSDVAIDDISIHFGSCSGSFPGLASGTKPPTTTVVPPQQVCNLDCSFDQSLCSWDQMMTDAFDWTWHSGSTPTRNTGPSADHTGDGHYLYIEASSVTYGDTARLISSECSNSGAQCLQFWYHMYGSADTMGLHVYVVEGRNAHSVWRQRNDQGNMWHLAQVDLSTAGSFQIIFEGRRGSTDVSDVAIDDISLHYGPCSALNKPTTVAPATELSTSKPQATTIPVTPQTTEYPEPETTEHPEIQTSVMYTAAESTIEEPRTTARQERPATPDEHTAPTEYPQPKTTNHLEPQTTEHPEIYTTEKPATENIWTTEGQETSATGEAQTVSTEESQPSTVDPGTQAPTALEHTTEVVPVSERTTEVAHPSTATEPEIGTWPTLPEQTADHTGQTISAEPHTTVASQPPTVAVKTTVGVPVETTANPGPPATTEGSQQTTAESQTETARPEPVATTRPQPTTEDKPGVCNLGCSFDQSLCSWNQMMTDAFDWTWHSGSTPTLNTGPSADHTGGGHYLYIEASSVTYGDTARLISSECSNSGAQCLQFWYHMYGSADTMGLHVYVVEGRNARSVWRQRNDQGNTWHLGQVDLTTAGAFQIIFEGRRGSNDQSDVAIDDVSLHYGPCSGLNVPTTVAPITTAEVSTTSKPETTMSKQTPEPIETAAPSHPPADSSTAAPPDVTTTTPHTTAPPPDVTTTTPHTTAPHPDVTTTTPHTTAPHPDVTTTTPHTTAPASDVTNTTPHTTDVTNTTPQTTAPPPDVTNTTPHTIAPHPDVTNTTPHTTAPPPDVTTTTPHTTAPHPDVTTTTPHTTAPPPDVTTTTPHTTAPPPDVTTTTPHTTAPHPDVTNTTPHTIAPHPDVTNTTPHTTAPPPDVTTTTPHTTAQPPDVTTTTPHTTAPHPDVTNTTPHTIAPHPDVTTTTPHTTIVPPDVTNITSHTTAAPPDVTTTTPHTTAAHQTTTVPMETTTTVRPYPPTTTTAEPLPAETPSPTPSCPANSHYSHCVSACTPTCTHLSGPPGCSDNDCVAGCVCDDGYVLKNRVCVPVQECGCVDNRGNKYKFDEVWYTSHCSDKCKCEKHRDVGRIECKEKDECDGNAVCFQNNNGEYYCEKTGFSDCTINGDPEYRSFDNKNYYFEGEHSYVLVQSINLPNNLQNIYIEAINRHNEDDDDDDSSEERDSRQIRDDDDDDSDDDSDEDSEEDKEYTLRALKIRVYNHTIVFKSHRRLVVDGSRADTPLSPSPGIKIKEHKSRIYVKTDFGLSVEFDGHHKAEIVLPHVYKRKVRGLCGNFDGNKRNDFVKPDGTQASTVKDFGESWRV